MNFELTSGLHKILKGERVLDKDKMLEKELIENPKFYEGLPQVYAEIEKRLNKSAKEDTCKEMILNRRLELGVYFSFNLSKANCKVNSFQDKLSRESILLKNNYLLKYFIEKIKNNYVLCINPVYDKKVEENNLGVLRKYGFTKEKGLFIPEHKVIGLRFEEDEIKIDEEGFGLTITEDLSEFKKYDIQEIESWQFIGLDNRSEFLDSYDYHMNSLRNLYANSKIKATINRHNDYKGNLKPLSRMLLARIKDNKGEIFIGDLNNVCFDEVK